MKLELKKILTLFFCVLILLNGILIPGCNKNGNTNHQFRKSNIGSNSCEDLPYYARYTRLTYSHFQDIIADNYAISEISIGFVKSWNYNQNGFPQELAGLSMYASIGGTSNSFSAYLSYNGSYRYTDVPIRSNSVFLRRTFTASEVNDLILDYLEKDDNELYFFDGLEYTGLPTPYEYDGGPFGEGDYYVTISFGEPGTVYDEWAISKSMFADDPNPILQGLIDILETNFISQFEE